MTHRCPYYSDDCPKCHGTGVTVSGPNMASVFSQAASCPDCATATSNDQHWEYGGAPHAPAPAGGEIDSFYELAGETTAQEGESPTGEKWTWVFAELENFDKLAAHVEKLIAAAEARVRAEVWGKAHAVMNNVMTWLGTGVRPYYDAAADAGSKAIEKAALADGIDLTSLAKPE